MRLHRFIGDFDFTRDSLEISDRNLINQIKNVFRLKSGDEIILCDGKKKEALTRITDISKNLISLKTERTQENTNEPENQIFLYCSILRKENFELATQKATELGVTEIFPLITRRTVKTAINLARLEKIAKEAAEQSGRGIIPKIHEPITLNEALKHAEKNSANIFFRPSGMPIAKVKIFPPKVGVFIGPEGGWDEEETLAAEGTKMTMISLGKLILRAETAAAVGTYLAAQNFLQ